ncbi:DUF2785 domain-containing protein [Caldibacillus lycopersici]|uniref:DUF2785 domain-containing protein n=1 Tax=Perspicuibacillus lycopersici TaxID=1325689 RepID=A0AAE3LNZ4_9BACI|nr:DUF2785 domain-containing protein [Perspicuibacillus lycopersici]MCU9614382.1 DUF2785 domain-containing protein [Perspicuibacillus lycopersici]
MSKLLKEVPLAANELKIVLTAVKNGEKNWKDEQKDTIVRSMLEHIGSTDSELRDLLIYQMFYELIIHNQLENERLSKILEYCLSEQLLFKGIGEVGTDTVFTRSFTTLVIALIIYRDNADNFLSKEKLEETRNKLLHYIDLEKDVRGFVPEKGWAHSIAHAADAFDELVKNRKIKPMYYFNILHAIWNKIDCSTSVYIHDEDERMINPIIAMLTKGLPVEAIEQLLQQLPEKLSNHQKQLEEENYWFLVANWKSFLKSFYMKLIDYPQWGSLQQLIIKHLLDM